MDDHRTEITPEQRAYAENALHSLPFAQLIGMRLIELEIDRATIEIEMRPDLRQPSGVLHGGVTATLIDTAMAIRGANPTRARDCDGDDRSKCPLSPPAYRRKVLLHGQGRAGRPSDLHGLGRRVRW